LEILLTKQILRETTLLNNLTIMEGDNKNPNGAKRAARK